MLYYQKMTDISLDTDTVRYKFIKTETIFKALVADIRCRNDCSEISDT